MNAPAVFRFRCPACQAALGVKPELRGRRLNCPKCQATVRVPESSTANAPTAAESGSTRAAARRPGASAADRAADSAADAQSPRRAADAVTEVPVVCGVCRTRMYATADEIGQKVQCPDCSTWTEVKPIQRESRRRIGALGAGLVPSATAEEDEYRLQDDQLPWRSAGAPSVPAVCECCHTRLDVGLEHVGSYVTCPDCGRLNQVVAPSSEGSGKAAMEIPTLDAALAPVDPTLTGGRPYREHADELLTRAEEHYTRLANERPDLPPNPMWQGNVSFLFGKQIRILWVCNAGFLLLLIMLLAVVAVAGQPAAMLPALLLLVTAVPWIIGFMSTQLKSIVYNTSIGYDHIEHWPQNHVLEWLLDFWQLFAALAYANLPTYLVYHFDAPPASVWLVGGASTFVFYPIIVLSMMESGSRLLPYSDVIWASLWRRPGAWFSLYLQQGIFGGVLAGGLLLDQFLQSFGARLGVILSLCIIGAAGLIGYFRLLGRLVLVCVSDEEDLAERAERRLGAAHDAPSGSKEKRQPTDSNSSSAPASAAAAASPSPRLSGREGEGTSRGGANRPAEGRAETRTARPAEGREGKRAEGRSARPADGGVTERSSGERLAGGRGPGKREGDPAASAKPSRTPRPAQDEPII